MLPLTGSMDASWSVCVERCRCAQASWLSLMLRTIVCLACLQACTLLRLLRGLCSQLLTAAAPRSPYLQAGDACTVLDAVPQPVTLCGVSGHVHGGFLAAARNLVQPVAAALQTAAERCPGYPVLLCGHSLGGGVVAVLAMLLEDVRQRAQAAAEAGLQLEPEQAAVVEVLRRLGQMRCIGIGAAAAFCRELGMASHAHVTSVLFG